MILPTMSVSWHIVNTTVPVLVIEKAAKSADSTYLHIKISLCERRTFEAGLGIAFTKSPGEIVASIEPERSWNKMRILVQRARLRGDSKEAVHKQKQ